MKAAVYYNEIDPYCAAWLQNLMDAGHIAPGVIDTRSIEDVRPDELAGYTQCHFFAGIGVWSLALRAAGWPDSRRAWTGSCPCQPFSAAGKGAGFADERHLWPAWQHLINQCRPAVIFGEQVASKAVEPWIDLVHADLEGMGYAFGCVPFPSAGVGAPHIRDRSFWVADARSNGLQGRVLGRSDSQWQDFDGPIGCDGATRGLAHADRWQCERVAELPRHEPDGENGGRAQGIRGAPSRGEDGRLANTNSNGSKSWGEATATAGHGHTAIADGGADRLRRPGPTNGFWRAADWLFCTDGRWRPVEPGLEPLAHGAPARVGRLRAYGNAINAQAAQAFIESYCEARGLIALRAAA